MKTILFFALLVQASLTFAQTQFSCAANCGNALRYTEVTSTAGTLSQAYQKLVTSCQTSLFVQAKSNAYEDYDYTLASIQNACIGHQISAQCTCAANCGSAVRYREVVTGGTTPAQTYASMARTCTSGVMFVQAVENSYSDYDYTFATLQNACSCY